MNIIQYGVVEPHEVMGVSAGDLTVEECLLEYRSQSGWAVKYWDFEGEYYTVAICGLKELAEMLALFLTARVTKYKEENYGKIPTVEEL